MDTAAFQSLVKRENAPGARGKFLSRVFGIFSESIVQIWAGDERAPYKNLGRPTLRTAPPERAPTLDFLFECRQTGRRFVVEQKCEIEFKSFQYFVLSGPHQLKHHSKPAFAAFLAAARGSPPAARNWKIGNQSVNVDGAILVWGAVTPDGRSSVMQETGLHDVIGLDRIVADCAAWKPDVYASLLSERRQWCDELFDFLEGEMP